MDYYKVSVADRKTLSVTLSDLPANYRVIVQSPPGVNQAFSDNDGLADENVEVNNTSGATVEYTVIVMGYGPVNNNPYKLTVALAMSPRRSTPPTCSVARSMFMTNLASATAPWPRPPTWPLAPPWPRRSVMPMMSICMPLTAWRARA